MVHADGFVNPILVTGASGYLGQHVVAVLAARGIAHVPTCGSGDVGVACHLLWLKAVKRLIETVEPSQIIHCAAVVPKTPEDYHDWDMTIESAIMAANVALYAQCPIVFASSLTAEHPASAYARGKAAAELLMRPERDRIVRLPGLYGPPRESGRIYDAQQARAHGEPVTVPDEDWLVCPVTEAANHLVNVALGVPSTLAPRSARAVIQQIGASA
jgi:nucleoside-diphosphate-sugar epimerase